MIFARTLSLCVFLQAKTSCGCHQQPIILDTISSPKNNCYKDQPYFSFSTERSSFEFPNLDIITMGGLKKRGCFGAASRKRGEESSKFPIAIYCSTFFFNYLYKILRHFSCSKQKSLLQ